MFLCSYNTLFTSLLQHSTHTTYLLVCYLFFSKVCVLLSLSEMHRSSHLRFNSQHAHNIRASPTASTTLVCLLCVHLLTQQFMRRLHYGTLGLLEPPLGTDGLQHWTLKTKRMKEAMTAGVFQPFKEGLERGLTRHGSNLKQFEQQASAMLRNRKVVRSDGASVRDPSNGDALFLPFLNQMQLVAQHMIDESRFSLNDVADFECYLFFTSCLLGTATLRAQSYRHNLIDGVFMDEDGFIHESLRDPLILKVKGGLSGCVLTADMKPKDSTLAWLMMVCAVRPMRSLRAWVGIKTHWYVRAHGHTTLKK
jgi:hypothetical protein